MVTGIGSSTFRQVLAAMAMVLGVCWGWGWSAEPAAKTDRAKACMTPLVQRALESELAGRGEERNIALRKALEQSPDDALAHWQSGEVCLEGSWLSPGQVSRLAGQDPRLLQYQKLREAAAATVDAQAALARWCHKNRLSNQERVHWTNVLELQPDNPEAIKGLDLHVYQGMLLTHRQIAELKAQIYDMHRSMEHWTPVVARWQKALRESDESSRGEVMKEVAAAPSPGKLMALELAIRERLGSRKSDRSAYRQVSGDMVAALKEMPQPAAAESLARYAVFSPFEQITAASCAALKLRPLDQYAPLLLSWLGTPIEASVHVMRDAAGRPSMQQSFFREGRLVNVSYTILRDAVAGPNERLVLGLRQAGPHAWQQLLDARAKARTLDANVERSFVGQAGGRQRAIDNLNAAIASQNRKVSSVLAQCTGVELGADATPWWDWWLKYNDWYDPDESRREKETVEFTDYNSYYDTSPVPCSLESHSCFACGTKVWTLSGRLPIERIKAGDEVLSQDVETGELQYKPVLRTTINPLGRTMKIGLGKESITCTAAHPLWVVGDGWRFARQLAPRARLHALSGGVTVEAVEKLKPEDTSREFAFNLIVADFHTYFVGEQGILVHDNSERGASSCSLPGYAKTAVAATGSRDRPPTAAAKPQDGSPTRPSPRVPPAH
jgi:hypothetical protein